MSAPAAGSKASGKGRTRDTAQLGGSMDAHDSKRIKLAPIFASAQACAPASSTTANGNGSKTHHSSDDGSDTIALPSNLPGKISWVSRGSQETCLVGTFGSPAEAALKRLDAAPSSSTGGKKVAVAMFDLDWTLVKPTNNKRWPSPKDPYDFAFLYPSVIRKVQECYQKGRVVAIVSNQFQTPPTDKKSRAAFKPARTAKMQNWQAKLLNICRALRVPCYIFSAMAKDVYRKPHRGMWDAFLDIWTGALGRRVGEIAMTGKDLTSEVSFYVGDFAGRRAGDGMPADHRDTDRKFAINAGLKFFTPEEFFLEVKKRRPFELAGFDARDFLTRPPATTSPTIADPTSCELVLFVGPPGAGKSSFYHKHFAPHGYAWVNQDTLKSRDKCLQAVERHLGAGKSCVVDNTNRDRATRAYYIDLAKRHQVPVRCLHFSIPIDQAWHQNLYRAFSPGSTSDIIPPIGFTSFQRSLEIPTRSEGLSSVESVAFSFQGTEAERERFSMYYATLDDF